MANSDSIKLCECGCGQPTPIATRSDARKGAIKGLPRRFIYGHFQPNFVTHGHSIGRESPTYCSWLKMKSRCLDPRHRMYKWYGARGIGVCDRWLSFSGFLADMGERPNGTSLDRIDNNGDYEPSNCRWASKHQQAANTSRTIRISYSGKTMPLSYWADELGINRCTLFARFKLGQQPPSLFRKPRRGVSPDKEKRT